MSASLKPQQTDLKELQQQQIEADGDLSTSKEAKQKGNVDSSYELPTHAAHRLHLKLSTRVHRPDIEDYEDKEEVVELTPSEFDRMQKNGSFKAYKKQEILHDPRSAAVQKASKTGDVPSDTPADPKGVLNSLQAVQMRYEQLSGHRAPANKSFEELLDLVAALEKALKAAETTDSTAKKPMRSLVDAQERYKELVGKEAPQEKTFTELKEAIAHFESPEGAGDLEAAKA